MTAVDQRQRAPSHRGGRRRSGWHETLIDQARGLAGAMVVGVTLLYTMEVWWVGRTTSPGRALLLLGVITADTPPSEALGKIVVESVPLALGVVLADFFVDKDKDQSPGEPAAKGTLIDLGSTALGAAAIGLTIAPTDEVPLLHAAASPVSLLAIVAVSLVLSYVLVFVAGFSDQQKRREQPGVLQRPVTETVVAYVVSLIVSALMLGYFQNLAIGAPLHESIGHVIVLGLPAAVGGALGRIVI